MTQVPLSEQEEKYNEAMQRNDQRCREEASIRAFLKEHGYVLRVTHPIGHSLQYYVYVKPKFLRRINWKNDVLQFWLDTNSSPQTRGNIYVWIRTPETFALAKELEKLFTSLGIK